MTTVNGTTHGGNRYGFTTGSCAAAAAKAAAYMLLTGKRKETITIETPKGIPFPAKLENIKCLDQNVSCAVRKDGGDDPDITTGTLIYAKVSFVQDALSTEPKIIISGGTGVGRVTKPGLDQPVGDAAINHIPREMIIKEVTEVCEIVDYRGTLRVEISVPEGITLAKQTFNPRLGIVGGISILGTSGIVEPMSSQALLDTIQIELHMKRVTGCQLTAITPGNYGQEFMKTAYGYDLDESIKCSNFIGQTIDMAKNEDFSDILVTGHIGKLVKVAGGIMNTHSREGDCRMELLMAAALHAGGDNSLLKDIMECVSTEEAMHLIEMAGIRDKTMQYLLEQILYHLRKRAGDHMNVECIIYANTLGELAKSNGADMLLQRIQEEKKWCIS
ncbi:MAG: cobalt-precorrin-5B (C(1))-methyltransferase CbiD [Lachnospiraceae bacterium]|nr:cobalt-precorrin-5B (C(1))-methyltransferase CbiD [Lachnospiraceae bacterium]